MKLRPYQGDAVDCTFKEWETHQATLVVLPTGCGKTRVASEVILRSQPKRTLFIAHREELIFQAKRQIHAATGLEAEIEMAEHKASHSLFSRMPVVVSTIQTQIAGTNGSRMTKFNPNDFGLIIIDECHHSTATTYKKVLDYYCKNPNIKILGITATPDRSDKEALGKIFQSVAYSYKLPDAINDGWLVPIHQRIISVGALDFSSVRTTAGDLNGADLARVMEQEKNIHEIVAPSIEILGERKAIAFMSSVRHAEMCCEIFNRHRVGMASWICGKTPKDERRTILKDFTQSKTQILCNVGIATEGFDCPDVDAIIMGRPTESRSFYTQMVGRGTRSLTGTLDDLHTPEDRRQAIANSKKPHCTVLDFVGNSGKHKLITAIDILGGKYSDEIKAIVAAKLKKDGTSKDIQKALEETEDEIRKRIQERLESEQARKAKLVASVKYSVKTVDPFDIFDLHPINSKKLDLGRELSAKCRDMVKNMGVDPDQISYVDGMKLVREQIRRWQEKLCTTGQAKILMRFGYSNEQIKDMKFSDASKAIDVIAKNGWKRSSPIHKEDVAA